MSGHKRVKRRTTEPLPLGTFLDELHQDAADPAASLEALALPLVAVQATPPDNLKLRLLASLEQESRFAEFEERFAALADLPGSVAGVLLNRIDTPGPWMSAGTPGVEIFHFDGGPRVRDAITGFVRMRAGSTFPMHEHMGHESVLVLQGVLRDDDGEEYFPGDEIEMDASSSHQFSSVGEIPLIIATIVMIGVTIDGKFIPPGDPRA